MFNFKKFIHLLLASTIVASDLGHTINNYDDMEDIVSCVKIGGTIKVTSKFKGNFNLPNLKETDNGITINGDKIIEINLGKLERAYSVSIVNVTNLETLGIASLTRAYYLKISNTGHIRTLNLNEGLRLDYLTIEDSKIDTIAGFKTEVLKRFELYSLSEAKEFDFSHLKDINSLRIKNATKLTKLSFGNLTNAGVIEVTNLEKLEFVSFPILEEISSSTFKDLPKATVSIPYINNVFNEISFLFVNNLIVSDHMRTRKLRLENIVKPSKLLFNMDHIVDIKIKELANLELLSFPNLKTIHDSASFKEIPKATVAMPSLTKVENKLSFNFVNKVDIPRLQKSNGFSLKNTNSNSIELNDLEKANNFHIFSNNNLESINLPMLCDGYKMRFETHENRKLFTLSIPKLLEVETLHIDEPELSIFEYDKHLSGNELFIRSKLNCSEFEHNNFEHHKCSSLSNMPVVIQEIYTTLSPPVNIDTFPQNVTTSNSSTINNITIKHLYASVDSFKNNIIDFEINDTSSSSGAYSIFKLTGLMYAEFFLVLTIL